MTMPRHETVDHRVAGTYHCWSRCVRRAFLCGFDRLTGRSYEHRRKWSEDRLRNLEEIFAISILAYAIMENHNHLVIQTDPSEAARWSDEEVARRWLKLFPRRKTRRETDSSHERFVAAFVENRRRVEDCRARLSDISWFMRCFKENIARRANIEDEVTGAFWEGRFKCSRLDDERAILACMVYVDLNPVRAGIATTSEESLFTSIRTRIRASKSGASSSWLKPIAEIFPQTQRNQITFNSYLKLVDLTALDISSCKRDRSSSHLNALLAEASVKPLGWRRATREFQRMFPRMAGTPSQLERAAQSVGRNWFKGKTFSRELFA